MAVTEQTNVGDMSADVYCSVSRADAWLSTSRNYARWNNLTTAQKEKLLLLATSYLDSYFIWYGTTVLVSPGLRWPRLKIYDLDNRALSGVPDMIRYACAEIALYFLLNDPFSDSSSYGIDDIKLDVIQIKFTSSVAEKVKLPASIITRLSQYGHPLGTTTSSRGSSKVIAS